MKPYPYVAVENGRRVLAEWVDAINALDAYRKATGGLPPELVAKALAYLAWCWQGNDDDHRFITAEDIDAITRATFEVPT